MSSWTLDPTTGDYKMGANGAPIPTDDLRIPAYYRIRGHRGKWIYAPNNQWGSDLYLTRKRFASNDISGIASVINNALQPMVDDGRAISVSTDVSSSINFNSRSDVALDVDITDAQGKVQSLNLPPLGV